MNTKNFMQEVEKTYKNHFPKSLIRVKYSSFYPSIDVTPVLAGNRDEVTNGIWQNDILSVSFTIDNNGKEFNKEVFDGDLPDEITISADQKSYAIKPDSVYLAYGHRKLSFRKTQGNPEKILSALDKFFASLKKSLSEDLESGNIADKNHLMTCENNL